MTQHEREEGLFLCLLLGFLALGLMDQQKRQIARIGALRKKLNQDGFNTDEDQLRNDWQNVRSDLNKATIKTLNDVENF